MLTAIMTYSYLNADGSSAKPERQVAWDNLTKQDVEAIETASLSGLTKLNALSAQINSGAAADPGSTNPVTLALTLTVSEDAKLWFHAKFVWPKSGDETQALIQGAIDGELANVAGLSAKARA